MPELPEVETTRRGIEKHIVGQTIERVVVRQPQLRYLIDKKINKKLARRNIVSVSRRAKYLIIHVEKNNKHNEDILIHLGMSGSLRIVTPKESDNIKKHDHVDWHLSNGKILRYHDPRRFGVILLANDIEDHKLLSHLGPEPLIEEFNAAYLKQRAKNKKTAVKAFIMDQKIVVGVGNIYASEALFLSGIHPKREATKVSMARYELLVENIKIILAKAIEQGGTTLKDFVNSDGQAGYFQQQLHVYGRKGQPCGGCGNTLKEIKLAQRSSVFCPTCQK